MGITYGTGESSIFVEPVLGLVMVPVIGMILGTTHGLEILSKGSGYGKYDDSCVEKIM